MEHTEFESKYEAKSVQDAFRVAEEIDDEHRTTTLEFENNFGQNNPFFDLMAQIDEEDVQGLGINLMFDLVKEKVLESDFDKKDEIIAYISKITHLIQSEEALEKNWYSQAEQLLLQRRSDVIKTTDWDALTTELLKDDSKLSSEEKTELCFLTTTVVSPFLGSIRNAGDSIKIIDKLQILYSQYGFDREETESIAEDGWLTQGDLEGTVQNWESALKRVGHYLAPNRRTWLAINGHEFEWQGYQLRMLMKKFRIQPETEVPTTIMNAFENRAADLMLNLKQRSDEQFKQLSERSANSLFITNAEALTETTGIDDPYAWINERLDRYPSRFVESIGFIEFVENDIHDDNNESNVVGEHKKTENKLYIDTRKATFLKYNGKYSQQTLRSYVKKEVQATLDHEIGHHVHSKIMGLDDLIEWETILGEDPEPMDAYMDEVRQEWLSSGSDGMRTRYGFETFATAFALYMQDPIKLASEFPPERFAYFNQRLKLYNDNEVAVNILLLNSRKASQSAAEIAFFREFSNEKIGAKP
ncbi:MAG TPA: hypothetical protein VLA77_00545 [Candidatus Saccharimonadales bacterium]|nr:hypothetical protein [Candidatus Saccharimonadales bacterium]